MTHEARKYYQNNQTRIPAKERVDLLFFFEPKISKEGILPNLLLCYYLNVLVYCVWSLYWPASLSHTLEWERESITELNTTLWVTCFPFVSILFFTILTKLIIKNPINQMELWCQNTAHNIHRRLIHNNRIWNGLVRSLIFLRKRRQFRR